MIDRRPALIARCIGKADVIACVRFAREHDLLLCIKSGRSQHRGLATADGAFMLDLSFMRGVWVDRHWMIAHAQGGCLLGDVDYETQLHGLATVLGFVSRTGIAGLTLGGGFGYLTRRWGWTSDNVVGMDVVTADAQLVRASSERERGPLLGPARRRRQLRRRDRYRLPGLPAWPEIVGGVVAWPADQAAGVLELFRELARRPRQNSPLPPCCGRRPQRPGSQRNGTGSQSWDCSPATPGTREAEKAVARSNHLASPSVICSCGGRTRNAVAARCDAAEGSRYYWEKRVPSGHRASSMSEGDRPCGPDPSPFSAVILFQLGGALSRLAEETSAAGNRDAQYVLNLTASWNGRTLTRPTSNGRAGLE